MYIFEFRNKNKQLKLRKMEIKIASPKSIYITIDNHTYYIDNSSDEQIMDKWSNDVYVVRDREAGSIIVNEVSLEEAEKIVAEFEAEDIKENNYIPNFYEIVKL